MATSDTSDAVLLLTAHLSGSEDSEAKPLTTEEWGAFASWLKKQNAAPEHLLAHAEDVLRGWFNPKITTERIKRLLGRGSALGLAKDRWAQAGLWWLTRADEDYPARLKKRLGQASPAVLYGCGRRTLLGAGGIAVVGSRAASENDLAWTEAFGGAVADAGYSVVSGGARGVDRAAMFGALDKGGTVVGILADSLLRASSSKMYRPHLRSQDLVLVSPFHPEAGFTVGRAMQRNRYIYCLSDKALVVHSGIKGGTWEGAIENIKRQWVPIWVRQDSDGSLGNAALLSVHHAQGPPQEVIERLGASDRPSESNTVPIQHRTATQSATSSGQREDGSLAPDTARTAIETAPSGPGNGSEQSEPLSPQAPSGTPDLYGYFIQTLQERLATGNGSVEKSELERHYGLVKGQVHIWMERAVAEGVVVVKSRPVRFELPEQKEEQLSFSI